MLSTESPPSFNELLHKCGVVFWQADKERQKTIFSLPSIIENTENNPSNTTEVRNWLEQVHPDDLEKLEALIRTFQQSEGYELDYRVKASEDSFFWIREIAKPRANEDCGLQGLIYSIEEMKSLEKRSISAAEDEQRNLGRELHDDLCQQLVGMLFFTNNLMHQINSGKNKETLSESALEIKNQLLISIDKTRSISKGLNPVNLEHKSFEDCILELTDQFKILYSAKCSLDLDPNIDFTNKNTASHLFRIIQEGINNAIRHGRANLITITLQRQNEFGILKIRDNGSGIKPTESQSSGMGLNNLNFRAQSIRATIEIGNHPEGGAQLQCNIPLSLF